MKGKQKAHHLPAGKQVTGWSPLTPTETLLALLASSNGKPFPVPPTVISHEKRKTRRFVIFHILYVYLYILTY